MFLRRHIPFLVPLFIGDAQGYNHETCCKKAKADKAFVGLNIPSFENQTCGQAYSPDLRPTTPLFIPYRYCSDNCGGIGLHKVDLPGSWAAPLVQFILPSVIFSMTIPRQHKIEYDYLFDWPKERTGIVWVDNWLQLLISMVLFVLILLPVIVDTILWMCTIIVGAGNMLVGGLYEAHLDYRIITYVQLLGTSTTDDSLRMKRELLVTIAAGNLKLEEGNPQELIPRAITVADPEDPTGAGHEKSRSRLLNLLGAQSSFGSAVGSPVLFYLGAFAYSILDLFNDRSSEAAAISLGFGIEWMIIVHVAMVSGCLLASNNPSTSSGIVGSSHKGLKSQSRMALRQSPTLPLRVPSGLGKTRRKRKGSLTWERFATKILGWSNSYDTEFQPVSLWDRGTNKMRWVENCDAFKKDMRFREIVEINFWGWVFKVYVPCLLLIVLPPATGGVVAYFTPPKGIACRSLSFIVYAACQVVLVTIATIHAALDDNRCEGKTILRKIFTGYGLVIISSLFWFGSLISAVGGTVMQIIGVYNNCICYAGANSWWNIWRVHPTIQLATDTANARQASVYWIWMGSTAAVFMALNCYVGWWYQRLIRHRFQRAVKAMYVPFETGHPSPAPSSNDEFQHLLPRVEGLGVPMFDGGRQSFESDIGEGVEMANLADGGVRRAGRTRESFGEWEGRASSSLLGVSVGGMDNGEGRSGLRPVWSRPSSSSGGS